MFQSANLRWPVLIFLLSGCLPSPAQDTLRQYLSGRNRDDAIPWQFNCTAGRNSNRWTTIPVPSNWELQGFGTFTYGYELGKSPRIPNAAQGRYKHTFQVPADWSGRRIFLVFEGVMTDAEVRVNGQPAGPKHQGGFYRFKFDVTRLLKYGGNNLLEVLVDEESSDISVNAAERRGDYWNYAGIYRPVYLEAVPPEYIERVVIDARADGRLTVDVFGNWIARGDSVEAQVLDLDGHPAGGEVSLGIGPANQSRRLTLQIRNARQWTAETPVLYQVEARLRQGARVLHRIRQRFGFRTIEVRPGSGIFVNGTRVLLKGINRHTFWPDSGRTSSEKISRDDIGLIKDMNMNAVRMSHYPPDQHFLDACDEMGLYVLDELAGWQHKYDAPIGRKLVAEMVQRDVNHPSIVLWDNGNEGGWNGALDGEFSKWDPQQRHVIHPMAKADDIDTYHYPEFLRFLSLVSGKTIFMPTELLHGLYDGGLGAGLEDYWRAMLRSKVGAGGFLWSFVDEAVKRVDLDGRLDTRGNLAPDGILGPYREKEASYYTVKELWSPITVVERSLPAGFKGTLTIENRYSFTDALRCGFTWQLRRFRRPGEPAGGFTAVATGTARPDGSVPPGARGLVRIPLPEDWQQADALALRIDEPSGRELWTWVWPLPGIEDVRSICLEPGKQKVAEEETGNTIKVRSGDLTVAFNRSNGWLASVTRGGKSFSLANGPRPAAGQAELTSLEHHDEAGDHVVSAVYRGNMKAVRWRIRGNGWVQLDYSYSLEGPQDFFGVSFDYPESCVRSMRWLGKGPYRAWKNRIAGGTLNVWENQYNDTITGATGWTYPEFKGYYSGVRWVQLQTTEGPITACILAGDLFVQVFTPRTVDADLAGNTLARFPDAGLSFLHAIPGIGSKFSSAESTGPQGLKTIASGEYAGSVSFYFGKWVR